MDQLSLPADYSYSRDVQSPALQQYYSVLQALALNQAQPEWQADRDDNMRPPAPLDGSTEEALQKFKNMTGLSDDAHHAAPKVLVLYLTR